MNRSAFHDLLRSVDERFAGRPAALERATARWVLVGQSVFVAWLVFLGGIAGVAGLVALTVEAPGNFVGIGLGVGIALFALSQFSLLYPAEVSVADGPAIRRDQAPEFWALLDDLRREMACRPFDEVRITTEFNASVVQAGRTWTLGRPRVLLQVGLPTLLIFTPAELRAVLAHEFVHLSARHGRGQVRVHRLLRRWSRLFERLNKPGGRFGRTTRWVASTFIGWYWPRLQARVLTLTRHHEFHADAVAASVAGRDQIVWSLWRLDCRGPWLAERFWPDELRRATTEPQPPTDIMARLDQALRVPPDPVDAERWADQARKRRTVVDETHPSFTDRARALGMTAETLASFPYAADPPEPAAADLLGPDRAILEAQQSTIWREGERLAWRDRYRRAQLEARRAGRTEPLLPAPKTNPPTSPERFLPADPTPALLIPEVAEQSPACPARDLAAHWQAVRAAADLHGTAAVVADLQGILGQAPDHPGAGTYLGQHEIKGGKPEGEALLWRVARSGSEQWTTTAGLILENHYRATGQADRQREAREHLDQHDEAIEEARRERAEIGPGDRFEPHGLTAATLAQVVARLDDRDNCAGAWLVRKAVRHFPDRPVFVLAVRANPRRWGRNDADGDAALVRSLVSRVDFAGQVLVVTRSGGFRALARVVEGQPGARIYPVATNPVG